MPPQFTPAGQHQLQPAYAALPQGVGSKGLWGERHMACLPSVSAQPWLAGFVPITRQTCLTHLPDIERP